MACAGALVAAAHADTDPHAGMLRWPDVGRTHIVFSYANDLWLVPKNGGVASPLASPPGQESFPKFSNEDKAIAFVGNYEGNRDIYTIPVGGGIPTRVTHHPAAETLSEWAPDTYAGGNKLLVMSNGQAGLARQTQMFSVDAAGGLPQQLPVPYSGFGSISPDGVWLAYTPHSVDNRTWKRYRGGMATDIWLFNLNDKTSKKITDWEGVDTIPMWVPGSDGSTLYYLSDNGPEHRMNIWAYSVKGGTREQVTKFTDDDVRWPSVGPGDSGQGEIVFQLGAELRLLNLGTRQDRVVKVTIPGDRPTVKPRIVDASKRVESASISPSGKRVVVEGRGDLWSAPAKEGVVRNLTRTDGVFERSPSWSPDGKWIAYFSDETGEYELWVRPADAKLPEEKKDDAKKENGKKDDANKGDAKPESTPDGEKKDADKKDEKPAADAAPGWRADAAPRKVTTLGPGFRQDIIWSPDSKHLTFTDEVGRLQLCEVGTGTIKTVDQDPWGTPLNSSWSHDSQWLAYARSEDSKSGNNGSIWLYNVKSGEKTRVTGGQFADSNPVFDHKGDFLYFSSNRIIDNPIYSDIEGSFVYTGTQALYMAPLRNDVKSPWAPKNDEEEIKKEEPKKDDAKKDDSKKEEGKKDEAKKEDSKKDEPKKDDSKEESAKPDDGVSGSWSGRATGGGEGMPAGGIPIGMVITLNEDGSVTGTVTSPMGGGAISSGKYDKATRELTLSISMGKVVANLTGIINGDEISGSWSAGDGKGTWTAKRTGKGAAAKGGDGAKADGGSDKPAKEVKIDLDGFERRVMQVPVPSGAFGKLAVSGDNKLVYVRVPARGAAEGPAIKIFDPFDDSKEEKVIMAGAGGFEITPDGKKILAMKGGSNMSVCDASAGGGKATTVPTDGMKTRIDPRAEWKQIITETWRLHRDFFYEPTMHGVDWAKVRDHYAAMLPDCISREDVAYVQAEMVSELNIGHAYISSPGDVENSVPPVSVGMLGCDYELVKSDAGTAYRISKIYEGGPWDTDARGPLSRPGLGVKEGDFLLAVNGVPVETSKDPWAAFIGLADKTVSVTIGPAPKLDDKSHEVLVTPVGNEGNLRYRAYIEAKRKYVAEKSQGKVGYIYVPNTGVDGQSDLFRQFAGERRRDALIIDERWNGGGQIPTRFIELLNRPTVNYWARRHGNDWPWPPDTHQGPKCMLANGLAGSGGDDFPWLFKHNKIGKVIGMRTWGGLVGISGNPGLIDGGQITVPTFGFYETDGTWGVEGHGVDPDIEVIDDPAKMVNGGDPQLDVAIEQMLGELRDHPFVPPKRPASPNRAGMGIAPQDK
ncbi:MAG: PDZ domain-containing protein [Planctomycetes bacterium]|nr:PDZ domain-containing protein [Planctomycetota bacterium]